MSNIVVNDNELDAVISSSTVSNTTSKTTTVIDTTTNSYTLTSSDLLNSFLNKEIPIWITSTIKTTISEAFLDANTKIANAIAKVDNLESQDYQGQIDNLVDGISTTNSTILSKEVAIYDKIDSVKSTLDTSIAAVTQEVTTKVDIDGATAVINDVVGSKWLKENEADAESYINSLALTQANSAISSSTVVNALVATTSDPISGNTNLSISLDDVKKVIAGKFPFCTDSDSLEVGNVIYTTDGEVPDCGNNTTDTQNSNIDNLYTLWQYIGTVLEPDNNGWRIIEDVTGTIGFAKSLVTDDNGNITGWAYVSGDEGNSNFTVLADHFEIRSGSTVSKVFDTGYDIPSLNSEVLIPYSENNSMNEISTVSFKVASMLKNIDTSLVEYTSKSRFANGFSSLFVDTDHTDSSYYYYIYHGATLDYSTLTVGDNDGDDCTWLVDPYTMRVEANSVYEITATVKRTSGSGSLYIGVAGRNGTDTEFVNTNGDDSLAYSYYCCANDLQPSTTSYVKYSGYVTTDQLAISGDGSTPSKAIKLHPDVEGIAMLIIANYPDESGSVTINDFSIRKVGEYITNYENTLDDHTDKLTEQSYINDSSNTVMKTFWKYYGDTPTAIPTNSSYDDTDLSYSFDNETSYSKAIILAKVYDAEGGVHIGLNNVDLGYLSGGDGEALFYQLEVDAIQDTDNVLKVWSDSDDSASLHSIEVITGPTIATIKSSILFYQSKTNEQYGIIPVDDPDQKFELDGSKLKVGSVSTAGLSVGISIVSPQFAGNTTGPIDDDYNGGGFRLHATETPSYNQPSIYGGVIRGAKVHSSSLYSDNYDYGSITGYGLFSSTDVDDNLGWTAVIEDIKTKLLHTDVYVYSKGYIQASVGFFSGTSNYAYISSYLNRVGPIYETSDEYAVQRIRMTGFDPDSSFNGANKLDYGSTILYSKYPSRYKHDILKDIRDNIPGTIVTDIYDQSIIAAGYTDDSECFVSFTAEMQRYDGSVYRAVSSTAQSTIDSGDGYSLVVDDINKSNLRFLIELYSADGKSAFVARLLNDDGNFTLRDIDNLDYSGDLYFFFQGHFNNDSGTAMSIDGFTFSTINNNNIY